MIACICGFEACTEDELLLHFIEIHRLSYGLENSCAGERANEPADVQIPAN